jgi:hypothetical protein
MQRNNNQTPVLALTYRLEMFDTLSSSDPRQDRMLFMVPVMRNDNRDGLADRIFGSVTEDALRTRVDPCLQLRRHWTRR